MPGKWPISFPVMPYIELSTSGVRKLLDILKPRSKAFSSEYIPQIVLKELCDEITPLLGMIYRRSLATSQTHRRLERSQCSSDF